MPGKAGLRRMDNLTAKQRASLSSDAERLINLVVASGFVLERLGEPCADEAAAVAAPAVADTRVAPLFLHVRGRKPAPDSGMTSP